MENTGQPGWRPLSDDFAAKSSAKFGTNGALTAALEHDPEKWVPVFRKDHAQTKR
jgi:hypothetical protein